VCLGSLSLADSGWTGADPQHRCSRSPDQDKLSEVTSSSELGLGAQIGRTGSKLIKPHAFHRAALLLFTVPPASLSSSRPANCFCQPPTDNNDHLIRRIRHFSP
uniref:Secreted protein n=1 Tax=Globodera pallida TaxID=36090 RepID=A0A183CCV3_GLOPA